MTETNNLDTAAVDGGLAASRERLAGLTVTIEDWLSRRRAADRLGQYRTQLATIDTVLNRCLRAVQETIPASGHDVPEVDELCRVIDRPTVWISRVWRYFAERFRPA